MSMTDQSTPLVKLSNVRKTYETGAGVFPALNDVDLEMYSGELITIVGKSGAGKSTLVNMITGVDTLTSGEIWVEGTALHELDENQIALWRGQTMGVIYQSFELMPQLSLLDNVLLPMDMCGNFTPKQSTIRAADLLDRVGLADSLDSATAEGIFQLFENLVTEGKTILMVTHDWSLSERASRTLQLKDGILTGEVSL